MMNSSSLRLTARPKRHRRVGVEGKAEELGGLFELELEGARLCLLRF
jgi:hypothetical protein